MVRFLSRALRKPAPISENFVSDFYLALEDNSSNKSKLGSKKSSTPKSSKKSNLTTPSKPSTKCKPISDKEPQSKTFPGDPYNESSTKLTEPGFQRGNILGGISDSVSKSANKKDNSTSNLAISILEDYSLGSLVPEDTEPNSYNKKRPNSSNNNNSTINIKHPKKISASLVKEPIDSGTASISSDDPFGFFKAEREIKTKVLPIASPLKRKPLLRTSTTIAQARSVPQKDNVLDDLEFVLSTEPDQKSHKYSLRANKSKLSEVNLESKLLNNKKSFKSNKVLKDVREKPESSVINKSNVVKPRLGFKHHKLGEQDYKKAEKNLEVQKLKLLEHFKKIDRVKLEEQYV